MHATSSEVAFTFDYSAAIFLCTFCPISTLSSLQAAGVCSFENFWMQFNFPVLSCRAVKTDCRASFLHSNVLTFVYLCTHKHEDDLVLV
jgi:hypothetical protein